MPNVNNEILIWARETSGLELEQAAKKLQIKDSVKKSAVAKLLAYEKGEQPPTRAMLIRMAKQYRRPLLTFYMQAPPNKGDRGEDFRTLPEGLDPRENAQVDALIRDIRARQSLLKDTLIDEDEALEHSFIGSVNAAQEIHVVANAIIEALGFSSKVYRGQNKSDDAFKYLRSLTESLGIFVILAGNLGSHHSNIGLSVFRGFVIADKIAPFIVINDQDSKPAWCFTLLHELVHLWLGQTGVSGAYNESQLEKFCNDVAADILLPKRELIQIEIDDLNFTALAETIRGTANGFNVSSSMLSYSLYRIGRIDEVAWKALSLHFKQLWLSSKAKEKEKNSRTSGGPNYYVVKRNKLGNSLVGFAERMVSSGAMSSTKASILLGVRPLKLHKIFEGSEASQGQGR